MPIIADISFDKGALSALIFGGDGDYYDSEQGKRVKCEPATLKVGMTEANFSNKNLGAAGAIIHICTH